MSIDIRDDGSLFLNFAVTSQNAAVDSKLTTEVHKDKTSYQNGTYFIPSSSLLIVPTVANTTASVLAGCNSVKGIFEAHIKDNSAHKLVDSGSVSYLTAVWPVTDLNTACSGANALKSDFNAHITASILYHVTADATRHINSADADPSDFSTLYTLVGELKTDLNAHIADAGTIQRLKVVAP